MPAAGRLTAPQRRAARRGRLLRGGAAAAAAALLGAGSSALARSGTTGPSCERAGCTLSSTSAVGRLTGRTLAGSTILRSGTPPSPSSCSMPVSLACLSWRTSCCNASRSEPMTRVVSMRSRRSWPPTFSSRSCRSRAISLRRSPTSRDSLAAQHLLEAVLEGAPRGGLGDPLDLAVGAGRDLLGRQHGDVGHRANGRRLVETVPAGAEHRVRAEQRAPDAGEHAEAHGFRAVGDDDQPHSHRAEQDGHAETGCAQHDPARQRRGSGARHRTIVDNFEHLSDSPEGTLSRHVRPGAATRCRGRSRRVPAAGRRPRAARRRAAPARPPWRRGPRRRRS